MKRVVVIVSILLSGLNVYSKPVHKEYIDTISYTRTAEPQFFYQSHNITNKELIKMLDVNKLRKVSLGLRKSKRGYYINKGLSYLAGALVSYPFFSALLNKDLYAGPCVMAAGTVLVNLNVSKNYNKLLLNLVKEHNQKIIAIAKKKKYNKGVNQDQVL
jgi:hypothetical protein